MGTKLFWLLLSALLLVQCCQAKPGKQDSSSSEESKEKVKVKKGKDSSSSESSEEVIAKSPRREILEYAVKNFVAIGIFALEKGSLLLKNVLKDETVAKVQTEKMQEYIKEITQLVERMDAQKAESAKSKAPEELFHTLGAFEDGLRKINTTNVVQPSAEQTILELALKRNGAVELKQEVIERYTKFLEKFDKKLEERIAAFTEQEKAEKPEFFEWYDQYKAAQDLKQKSELLRKFTKRVAELESQNA